MSTRRAEAVYEGHVQGVGFRATARRIAEGYDVTGWVRNEPDGSVRLVVEGAQLEVNRFLEAIQQAQAGRITRVTVLEGSALGGLDGFTIQRDRGTA